MSTRGQSGERVPLLDGIRGIAILLVLWFHFVPEIAIPIWWLEWIKKSATGGWTGVQLFFVLSGFLITGILLDSKGSQNFFRNFYIRRCLRIFPLYYTCLIVVLLVLPALGLPGHNELDRLNHAAPWLWTYCANIGWWLQATPRMPWPAEFPDLRHFWSLAIEEHFYLVWPMLVVLTSMRQLKWICCALFSLSWLARIMWVVFVSSDSLVFAQTPFMLDALALGSLLAVTARDGTWSRILPYVKWIVIAFALPLIGFFLVMKGLWGSHWFMITFGISAASLVFAGSMMLALDSGSKSIPSRLIGSSPLRFFGKYSYGLYVVHPLVATALGNFVSVPKVLNVVGSEVIAVIYIVGIKLTASLVIAFVSWHLLEKHFLKFKVQFAPKTVTDLAPTTGAALRP